MITQKLQEVLDRKKLFTDSSFALNQYCIKEGADEALSKLAEHIMARDAQSEMGMHYHASQAVQIIKEIGAEAFLFAGYIPNFMVKALHDALKAEGIIPVYYKGRDGYDAANSFEEQIFEAEPYPSNIK